MRKPTSRTASTAPCPYPTKEPQRALVGVVREHHAYLLTHLMGHLDFLDEEIRALEERIEHQLAQIPGAQDAVARLDPIPGVSHQTAILIIAEVGVEVSRFPSDRHLAAWAGLAPGNNQTGGKQRPARARHGNQTLKRGLIQAAHGAARTKNSYFRSLYYRLAARRGKHRAAVAVARTILQAAYHMLARGTAYQDLGVDYFDRVDQARTTKRLVKRLSALGYQVSLTATGQAPTMVASASPTG